MPSSLHRGAMKWRQMKGSNGKVQHYNTKSGRKPDWSVIDQRHHEPHSKAKVPNPF